MTMDKNISLYDALVHAENKREVYHDTLMRKATESFYFKFIDNFRYFLRLTYMNK